MVDGDVETESCIRPLLAARAAAVAAQRGRRLAECPDRVLQQTRWRIAISTGHRTLTVLRSGSPVRTLSVVVGKPTTPTPTGLFAVLWAIPWHPGDFLGSWVLELTAHSDVLQRFDGGDGTVGIHGRGGASLLDPLGSARSHGCIRLANSDIDWVVSRIGASQLPGTPVEIS